MRYLTFLDYPTLEAIGAGYEARVKELLKENETLRQQIRQVDETKELELQELRIKTQIDRQELDAIRQQLDRINKKFGLV